MKNALDAIRVKIGTNEISNAELFFVTRESKRTANESQQRINGRKEVARFYRGDVDSSQSPP
jgi:hypothetical protein